MLHKVLRPISGPDGMIPTGEIVDTSGWGETNVRVLTNNRYIQPIESHTGAEPTVTATKPAAPAIVDTSQHAVPDAQKRVSGTRVRRTTRGQE